MPISCMLNNDSATSQQSKVSNFAAITCRLKGSVKTASACPAPGTPISEEAEPSCHVQCYYAHKRITVVPAAL